MSLLHRNIVAAAFQDMLRKFEPIAIDTAEAVISKLSPIAGVAIEAAEAVLSSSHVDSAVAAAGAPPASATPAAAPAAPAPVNATPVVPVPAANQAVLAAVDALGQQLATIATQLAALRSNVAQ